MDPRKLSLEELSDMIDTFIGYRHFDIEEAKIFVSNIIPNEIRDFEDRPNFAYPLTEICSHALKLGECGLAASAYQKALELAPTLEEVESITTVFQIQPSEMRSVEKIEKKMRKLNK